MDKVYICYANNDYAKAKKIYNSLTKNNIDICMVEHFVYESGNDYAQNMLDGIKSSNIFLLVLSRFTSNSSWVSLEINAAVKRNKKIFVIKVDNDEINQNLKFALGNSIIIKEKTINDSINKVKSLIISGGENGK